MTLQMDLPAADEYPTRKAPEPALLYRRDPVIWPGGEDNRVLEGPFSPEQLVDYGHRGYSRIQSFLNPTDVETYRAELRRLRTDPALRSDERVSVQADSGEVSTIFGVHKVSSLFNGLVHDPRIVERARQILGSDVYVHQSRLDHKASGDGDAFYWHSDFETWHAEDGMPRMRAVGFSLSLTDNLTHDGALKIMPGSHRTFVSCVAGGVAGGAAADADGRSPAEADKHPVGTPDQASLNLLSDQHGIDVITGSAGDLIVVDSNCMYGSGGGTAPNPRSNVFVVFNSVDNECTKPFSTSRARPEFLAAREAVPAGR